MYKKIRLEFKDCEKNRFYRTFLVKEDLNLFNFACAIVTAFRGSFEHYFLLRTNEKNYCPKVYVNSLNGVNNVLMDNYTVMDLEDEFSFIYNMNEQWKFNGKILETVESSFKKEIILLDGKGQGIWEGSLKTLNAYFEGKLDPTTLEEDLENGLYLPWNHRLSSFGDFDIVYNIEEEKELFFSSYKCDVEMFKEQMDKVFGICRYA